MSFSRILREELGGAADDVRQSANTWWSSKDTLGSTVAESFKLPVNLGIRGIRAGVRSSVYALLTAGSVIARNVPLPYASKSDHSH